MRKKLENSSIVQGYVYNRKVEKRTAKSGVEYYNGYIDVAENDDCLNIIRVTLGYVAPTYSSGKVNGNYAVVEQIANCKTVANDGVAEALKVRVTPNLNAQDYPDARNNNEMTHRQNIEGGFISTVATLPANSIDRNKFKADALIYKAVNMEDENYLKLFAYVFNFRNEIKPVEFTVRTAGGIQYFSSLEISESNPAFVNVWGQFKTVAGVAPETSNEDVAFGEVPVNEPRATREWEITGAKAAYEIGDEENGITREEINKLLADREIFIADEKKRREESSNATSAATPGASAAVGGFNF